MNQLFNDLPLYKVTVDLSKEDDGIYTMSLVDDAAVKKDFLKFADQKPEYSINDEKMIITGVALRADYPIYRKQNGQEFYVQFDAENIEKFVLKFMKEQRTADVNLQHIDGADVEGVYLFESFLLNDHHRLEYPEFKDVANGSWMVSYKVENEQVWNDIKSGKINGFSPELNGALLSSENEFHSRMKEITDILNLLNIVQND